MILTEWVVIEEKLHSCGHISEDVEAEEDDDQEGAQMSATVHDNSVEHQDHNQSDDMDDANTKNQDHQPLFITKHDIVKESLERMLDSL